MQRPRATPTALSIAGSDSGGGAGIQADLKAFARCGVHGMTALTAITAQSTTGVRAVHAVPPEIVLAQVRAVLEDIGVDAVKVGMLGTVEVTLAVAQALRELPPGTPVVVDPVMVAESGATLLEADAQRALVEEVIPQATVLTPNVPEARVLAGWELPSGSAAADGEGPARGGGHAGAATEVRELTAPKAEELAHAVLALGPRSVVLTGGHRRAAVDLFVDSATSPAAPVEIPGERRPDGAAHGSGCTHSSVLAAQLALGATPLQAARTARRLAGEAVARGLRDVGAGPGPVDVLDLASLRGAIIEPR
jgi:hydroxymethylpyrimidine/phosphomethylpyrimidine kinase